MALPAQHNARLSRPIRISPLKGGREMFRLLLAIPHSFSFTWSMVQAPALLKNLVVLSFLFWVAIPLRGQTVIPRHNYGAVLEPRDLLQHGAGQSVEDFDDYWHAMAEDQKPGVYMHYIGLSNLEPTWADDLKATLLKYPNHFVIPQIGLSMTADGNPDLHYEHRVAAGEFDQQIENLIEGFRRLAYPAYLRIGYEFNGVVWNGYQPETFKAAFIRITEKLRAADLEIATVWCGAMDGERNFFDYYPGDAYVDWFGLDLFSVEHFSDPWASAFLDSAHVHNKPVMIGETTPRYIGVTDGEADWEAWFVPFFDYMHQRPEIKQFGYINWYWIEWTIRLGINWADWGDARLQMNSFILQRYTDTIQDPTYLHASSESVFRQHLGYVDTVPPPSVTNLHRTADSTSVTLTWDPITDPSGLGRYIIYKNGEVVNFSLTPTFTEKEIAVGTSSYSVSAIDRAGNESAPSAPITVSVVQQERIDNGDFENGTSGWSLDFFDSLIRAQLTSDTTTPLEGTTSAEVSIQRTSGTDWHIQLRQFIQLTEGHRYHVSLRARASEPMTVPLMFQQNSDPFTIYQRHDLNLTTNAQSFAFSFTSTASETIAVSFFLGAIGRERVWVDDVSVVEIDPILVSTETPPPDGPLTLSVYPNPATTASSVRYHLTHPTTVRLEAFDVLGRRIKVLHNGWQPAGIHEFPAALSGFAAGLYVLRLHSTTGHKASLPFTLID